MNSFRNQPAGGGRPGGLNFAASAPEKNYSPVRIFTPCADRFRLLETMNLTAQNAAFGDVILFSPASSGFDQFRNQLQWGEVFRRANGGLADATGGMSVAEDPNTQADGKFECCETDGIENKVSDLHRGFLRQNPGAKTKPNPTSHERTPTSAYHQ
jgi:hypothetical protein